MGQACHAECSEESPSLHVMLSAAKNLCPTSGILRCTQHDRPLRGFAGQSEGEGAADALVICDPDAPTVAFDDGPRHV